MQIELGNTTFQLLPEKAVYVAATETLVIADLHLGKAMHFRKAGIQIPQVSAARDYERLHALVEKFNPQSVCFLGDLFHSHHNSEWRLFELFIHTYPDVYFILVRGNHDILGDEYYNRLNITLVDGCLQSGNLLYSHAPLANVEQGIYNIAGHIHPGCMLTGPGRQRIKLPCFYFHQSTFLLPAFGSLTGLYMMAEAPGSRIFCILKERVVEV